MHGALSSKWAYPDAHLGQNRIWSFGVVAMELGMKDEDVTAHWHLVKDRKGKFEWKSSRYFLHFAHMTFSVLMGSKGILFALFLVVEFEFLQ